MKKLDQWAVEGTQYLYDVNAVEAFKLGAQNMRERIYKLIIEKDLVNADNIKLNPELASYLLLEMGEEVRTLGDDNV